jgi:uncharacterized protein
MNYQGKLQRLEVALLQSLHLYHDLLTDEVGQAFFRLQEALVTRDRRAIVEAYGSWFSALGNQSLGWQEHLLQRLVEADNSFSRAAAQSDIAMPVAMGAGRDLQVLQQLYDYDVEAIAADVNQQANLAVPVVPWVNWWSNSGPLQPLREAFEGSEDWTDAMPTLVEIYRQRGVGRFGNYWAFRWQQGQLVGLEHPDPVALHNLVGYEWQQQALVKNTESLLNGHGALNVLLYGSRGTGKSSLVKSLLSRYGKRSLRLVEIAKADLQDLPLVVEQVRQIPQKFIFFVDDLSFEADEEQFKALKVVLEGSITARPSNVVVYATSNRRHLIREYFSDRPTPRDQDELSNWDTVQEKLSFSDRFGLTLTFEPTDQDTYLKIVFHMAQEQGIRLEPDNLKFRALQWATQQNGRSGRTARQFIDFLTGESAS